MEPWMSLTQTNPQKPDLSGTYSSSSLAWFLHLHWHVHSFLLILLRAPIPTLSLTLWVTGSLYWDTQRGEGGGGGGGGGGGVGGVWWMCSLSLHKFAFVNSLSVGFYFVPTSLPIIRKEKVSPQWKNKSVTKHLYRLFNYYNTNVKPRTAATADKNTCILLYVWMLSPTLPRVLLSNVSGACSVYKSPRLMLKLDAHCSTHTWTQKKNWDRLYTLYYIYNIYIECIHKQKSSHSLSIHHTAYGLTGMLAIVEK